MYLSIRNRNFLNAQNINSEINFNNLTVILGFVTLVLMLLVSRVKLSGLKSVCHNNIIWPIFIFDSANYYQNLIIVVIRLYSLAQCL